MKSATLARLDKMIEEAEILIEARRYIRDLENACTELEEHFEFQFHRAEAAEKQVERFDKAIKVLSKYGIFPPAMIPELEEAFGETAKINVRSEDDLAKAMVQVLDGTLAGIRKMREDASEKDNEWHDKSGAQFFNF